MIDIRNDGFKKDCEKWILEALTEASIKKTYVSTLLLRNIGKTTALVEFAKKYNFGVLLYNGGMVRHLREEFNYEYIYGYKSYSNLAGTNIEGVVFDEGVNVSYLKKEEPEVGLRIVTGYVDDSFHY